MPGLLPSKPLRSAVIDWCLRSAAQNLKQGRAEDAVAWVKTGGLVALLRLEKVRKLRYFEAGVFDRSEPISFACASNLPNLGKAQTGAFGSGPRYLLLERPEGFPTIGSSLSGKALHEARRPSLRAGHKWHDGEGTGTGGQPAGRAGLRSGLVCDAVPIARWRTKIGMDRATMSLRGRTQPKSPFVPTLAVRICHEQAS